MLFYCMVILIKNFAQPTAAIAWLAASLPGSLQVFCAFRQPRALSSKTAKQSCRYKSYFVRASPLFWPCSRRYHLPHNKFLGSLSDFCYFYAAKPPLKPYAKYGRVKMCQCLWAVGWRVSSLGPSFLFYFVFVYLLTALMSPC